VVRTEQPAISITHYQRRNRWAVRDLLSRNFYSHTHLDWQETDQWLDNEAAPIRLAWQHNRLTGVLATSVPLNNTCWIRLAAVLDHSELTPMLKALWNDLRLELRALGVRTAAWLMIRDWPTQCAGEMGFSFSEEIVTLRRASQTPPPDTSLDDIAIRSARAEDLPTMTQVDQAAFVPPWQMTLSDLRQAERVSANCTVALHNGRIVGYQLSTLYFDGAHLARLAVHPEMQGKGVGGALLSEVLRYFARRGVYAMTVNTQSSNETSQRLYLRYGFRHNGYNLPVWLASL
jgi:ribosomal-protein-alanine N-acetyltransferase